MPCECTHTVKAPQHIWMLWEKRHCDTYWLMLGWRQYWFPSQIQRQRHTAGERGGILTQWLHSRPHYCFYKLLSKAVQTKFLLQNKDFKRHGNWPIRTFIWFYSKVHLGGKFVSSLVYRYTVVLQAGKMPPTLCVNVDIYASREEGAQLNSVHQRRVWHTLYDIVFTLVKRSEVNSGHISRWPKKRLAVIIDDAITVWIKQKSVSPLALCPESYTSLCRHGPTSLFLHSLSPPQSAPLQGKSCYHLKCFSSMQLLNRL